MTNNIKETILAAFNSRHACKEFDVNKKISAEDFNFILETGRLSPSSFGFEPWKFLVIQNHSLREKILPLAWGAQRQLPSASHFLILLARKATHMHAGSKYTQDIMRDMQKLPPEIVTLKSDFFKKFQESSFKSKGTQNKTYIRFSFRHKSCFTIHSFTITNFLQIMKNWLDKYEEGGYLGTTNKRFDYNGAWNGQFQEGGKVKKPIIVESKNDPRYKAYQDSLQVYSHYDNLKKQIDKTKKFPDIDTDMKTTFSVTGKSESIVPKTKLQKLMSHPDSDPRKDFGKYNEGTGEVMKPIDVLKYPSDKWYSLQAGILPIYKKPEQQVIVKNTTPSSSSVSPVIERPKTKVLQNNIQPEDVVSNFDIEASTPIIKKQFIAPKYYNVEDVVNNGKSQTNYQWYPGNGEALRELSEESGDRRTMVPRYQDGGYKTGDKVKYGTPEYAEAYNRGEVITDKGVRSPIALDEVVIQNNYRRPRGFWEQYGDKIVEENSPKRIICAITKESLESFLVCRIYIFLNASD